MDKWYIRAQFTAIEEKMKERLQLVGDLVASSARKNAPVKTGTLKNSIDFEVDEAEKKVTIGTNVTYAPFIEWGTKFITPVFFLTQAYNENIPKIRKIFSKRIK